MAGTNPNDTLMAVHSTIAHLISALDAQNISFNDSKSLADLTRSPRRYIFSTGTYGAGVWRPCDDVHLVCMTDNSPRVFWALVAEKLGVEDGIPVPLDGAVDLTSRTLAGHKDGPLHRLEGLRGERRVKCKVYLRYCSIPPEFDLERAKCYNVPPYPKYCQPRWETRNLEQIIDAAAFAKTTKSHGNAIEKLVLQGYLHLRSWAEANGIFAAELGFLDGESLLWMVHDAFVTWERSNLKLLGEHLDHEEYTDIQDIEPNDRDERTADGVGRAGIASADTLAFIRHFFQKHNDLRPDFTIDTRSSHDTTSHISLQGRQEIAHAFAIAREATDLATEIAITTEAGFVRFIARFGSFAVVECECWAQATSQRVDFRDKIPQNLGIFMQHIGNISGNETRRPRLWPTPTQDRPSKCTYVVGLVTRVTSTDVLAAVEHLDFDASAALITATLAETVSLPSNDYHDIHILSTPLSAPPISTKFRTAAQVLSRLRHDPSHAAIEYEVGYEDRFEGLKWMALEDWGHKPTEAEDFIPEHRIRQVRVRGSDGWVWDRASKRDLT